MDAVCKRSESWCPFCLGVCPLTKRVEWNCRLLPNFNDAQAMPRRNTYKKNYRDEIIMFFSRFGNFNAHKIPNSHAEVLLLLKILGVFFINGFGVYLFFYWLMIDWAGIKVFITSVGVFLYAGMKFYEKYIDIKEKKRKSKEDKEEKEQRTKHHNY